MHTPGHRLSLLSLTRLFSARCICQRICSTTLILSFLIIFLASCGKSTEKLLSEAYVLDFLERYDEAIVIYDEVLEKDPMRSTANKTGKETIMNQELSYDDLARKGS